MSLKESIFEYYERNELKSRFDDAEKACYDAKTEDVDGFLSEYFRKKKIKSQLFINAKQMELGRRRLFRSNTTISDTLDRKNMNVDGPLVAFIATNMILAVCFEYIFGVVVGVFLYGIWAVFRTFPRKIFIKNKTRREIIKIAILEWVKWNNFFIIESINTTDLTLTIRDIYDNKKTITFEDLYSKDNPYLLGNDDDNTDMPLYYIERQLFLTHQSIILSLYKMKRAKINVYQNPDNILDKMKVDDHILDVYNKSPTLEFHVWGGRMATASIDEFKPDKLYTIESSGYLYNTELIEIEFEKRGLKSKIIPETWQWWIWTY